MAIQLRRWSYWASRINPNQKYGDIITRNDFIFTKLTFNDVLMILQQSSNFKNSILLIIDGDRVGETWGFEWRAGLLASATSVGRRHQLAGTLV